MTRRRAGPGALKQPTAQVTRRGVAGAAVSAPASGSGVRCWATTGGVAATRVGVAATVVGVDATVDEKNVGADGIRVNSSNRGEGDALNLSLIPI